MLEKFKKFKTIGIYLLVIVVFIFLISLFNIWFLNSTISAILMILFGIVILFSLGFKYGKKRDKKGYVAGIKVGIISSVIMFLISTIIFRVEINLAMFIYYAILLLSSVMGSMVGINKKKEE